MIHCWTKDCNSLIDFSQSSRIIAIGDQSSWLKFTFHQWSIRKGLPERPSEWIWLYQWTMFSQDISARWWCFSRLSQWIGWKLHRFYEVSEQRTDLCLWRVDLQEIFCSCQTTAGQFLCVQTQSPFARNAFLCGTGEYVRWVLVSINTFGSLILSLRRGRWRQLYGGPMPNDCQKSLSRWFPLRFICPHSVCSSVFGLWKEFFQFR